ncbi:MAG: hypothetical protein J0I41_11880 [Filimonas sp.]|nr:hypothetical protein [Filimonas sp.]
MKKITFLIVVISSIVCLAQGQVNSKKNDPRIDSLTKKLDQQIQHITSLATEKDRLQLEVDHLLEDKKKFDYWGLIPWGFTVITIVLSILVYRRDVSFRNISFVTEANKMKASDPTLWGFYNSYSKDYISEIVAEQGSRITITGAEDFEAKKEGKLSLKGNGKYIKGNNDPIDFSDSEIAIAAGEKIRIDGEDAVTVEIKEGALISFKGTESKKNKAKIRAYCYYKLNSFELIFNYNKLTVLPNKVWEDYMINSLIDSEIFYEIVKNESKGYLYNKKYRRKLEDFMGIADLCEGKSKDDKQKIVDKKKSLIKKYRRGKVKKGDSMDVLEERRKKWNFF